MKVWFSMAIAATLVLTGCSDKEDFPKACDEMGDMIKGLGKDVPKQQLEDFENKMQQAREQWKKMNKEEREQAKQQCETAKEKMEQMQKMLNAMKQ